MRIADPFSSRCRPVLMGVRGAVSAAHPLATAAGQEMLWRGGTAADAAIAAQAVIAVVAPEAGGLGGDGFFLIRAGGGDVVAVNAAGAAPLAGSSEIGDDGSSVAVPGLVSGWGALAERWGRLGLACVLEPAIRLARSGFPARRHLAATLAGQWERLLRGGAGSWPLFANGGNGPIAQPALAETLRGVGAQGAAWFYEGGLASAIAAAVEAKEGGLSVADLAAHRVSLAAPITVEWSGQRIHIQPPMSQGALLAMALGSLPDLDALPDDQLDHIAIELTEASFAYRDRIGRDPDLLRQRLSFDPERASRRGGPRAYLHTAGVAAADADGLVVSSLLSVFDDFGSAIYVPEGGFVLNNRAAGFTAPPNDAAPGKLPVHTLAPIGVETAGGYIGMATPGADGQVQTLLQILLHVFARGLPLAEAIAHPRWRSENGRLLICENHPNAEKLAFRGHDVVRLPDGDLRFGGLVCAGLAGRTPFAAAEWRRENWSGVVC